LTQNNRFDGLYRNQMNNGAGQIHIALMGDPTLRMHVVAPPSGLAAERRGPNLDLHWVASQDAVLGYHVYRAASPTGPFVRLTTAPLSSTSFTDPRPDLAVSYMVRGLKLETSGSGSYYNLSEGCFVTLPDTEIISPAPTVASRDAVGDVSPATHVDLAGIASTNTIPSSTGHAPASASLY
jgi:hypothetical protein